MSTLAAAPEPRSLAAALRACTDAMAAALEAVRQVTTVLEQAEGAQLTPGGDRRFSVKETAAELGISPSSVRNLIKRGRLRAEEHGAGFWRVPESEVVAYRRRITRGMKGVLR